MIIGLTGSMASGKSTVARILTSRGFPVVDADLAAHGIINVPDVRQKLAAHFGSDILDRFGMIARASLAKKAFASAEETAFLNSVTHPAVIELMLRTAAAVAPEVPGRPVVLDVPLLFEAKMELYCDKTLCVAADDEVRFRRIMLRDGITREEAAARISKQLPQSEKCRLADAVIENSGSLSGLFESLDRALASLGIPAVPGVKTSSTVKGAEQ